MKKFYVEDCPDDMSMHRWIGNQTNLEKYVNSMVPANAGTLFEFYDNYLDLDITKKTSNLAYETYGWYGFMNIFGDKISRSNEYGGISLVYNPDYVDKEIPLHAQTLGYTRTNLPNNFLFFYDTLLKKLVDKNLDKIFYNIVTEKGTHAGFEFIRSQQIITHDECVKLQEKYPNIKTVEKRILKNSYTDTWSFNQLTPAAKLPGFENITNRIKRSIVRSRLAQIKNINTDTIARVLNKFTWHRDDSWFYELRLNLSLDNIDNNFGIEIENLGKNPFKPGRWYMWDTLVPHCPYVANKAPGISRTNYVLAVNPWFDYDAENRCWIQNEYFGEKHPADMVLDGDVIEGLSVESLQ